MEYKFEDMSADELNSVYEGICRSISDDSEKFDASGTGEFVYFSHDENNRVSVQEYVNGEARDYTIHNPAYIDRQWIHDRIIITPSARKSGFCPDKRKTADWIAKVINPCMLMDMENIVFVADTEQDFEYLQEFGWGDELETNSLPDGTVVGISWFFHQKAFVNLKAIINDTDEMVNDGIIWEDERSHEIRRGTAMTIAHEIRHIAQANPYLPSDILNQMSDDENDAEEYAETVCRNNLWNTMWNLNTLP